MADQRIAELAARQHGIVARRQLLEDGISVGAIDERVGRRLFPIHRGVYRVGHVAHRVEGTWMAAVLASGCDAVLSHGAAGQLWGLVRRSGHIPEVTRPRHFRPRPGIRTHRSPVPKDERTVVDGIPVTTAPRTILDLASVVSKRQLERALNEMEVCRLSDRLSIPDLLLRYPRRRGSAVLRSLLEDRAEERGITKNDFEELFAGLVAKYRLPRPSYNADLFVAGQFFSVDCLWRKERLIVELDGRTTHGTSQAFEDDRQRDRKLMLDGWRVMRVTWRQLNHQQNAIVAEVRKALAMG